MITELINARLLDCVGDSPVENTNIVIENGLIRDIYQGKSKNDTDKNQIDCRGKTVMPGLIEAHSHYALTTVDFGGVLFEFPFFTALKIKSQLERLLQAGFTTIRDGGGGHWSHKQAVNDGSIAGPRILICGPLMSVTGGHGDFNVRGASTFPPSVPFVNLMRLCDGADDCRLAAREQFQKGCDHIKICITGGCASPNDEAWQVHLSESEVKAFCEEAKAHGKYVMAHSLNDSGNRLAVDCGVESLEHGSFLTKETAQLMKTSGTTLVSILAIVWWAEKYGKEKGSAEWFLRKLANPGCSVDGASVMEGLVRGAKMANDFGIPVGSGADYWGSLCGEDAMNIKLLVDNVGFSPYQALKSATIVNAEIIKLKNKTGSIECGKWADIIVVNGNPDDDINLMIDPGNILMVMKDGNVMKNLMA